MERFIIHNPCTVFYAVNCVGGGLVIATYWFVCFCLFVVYVWYYKHAGKVCPLRVLYTGTPVSTGNVHIV